MNGWAGYAGEVLRVLPGSVPCESSDPRWFASHEIFLGGFRFFVDMNHIVGVEYRDLRRLVPYERNARTHSAEQVEKLMESIRRFGFVNPILVDATGTVIAGHGRLMAATRMGMATVPVIEITHLSDADRRAYILADNRLAEDAGWDEALLRLELGDLSALDFDLPVTGFSPDEVAACLRGLRRGGLIDEDQMPALEERAVSLPGDLWLLGEHRVICGDCTDQATVHRLYGSSSPSLMVTDPPYGVEYNPAWRIAATGGSHSDAATGLVLNDDRADWRAAWQWYRGDVAYVWHAGTKAHIVAESLLSCGFEIRAQIVWVKQRHVLSRGHYHAQHEPCLAADRSTDTAEPPAVSGTAADEHELAAYVVRTGRTAGWVGGRKQSTVWFIENVKNDTGHSTQKPVECMRRPMENNSTLGAIVCDPFLGSGTSVIAAETAGRVCFGCELSAHFTDMIVRRWQAFVGQDARLDGDGRTFAEVTADRHE